MSNEILIDSSFGAEEYYKFQIGLGKTSGGKVSIPHEVKRKCRRFLDIVKKELPNGIDKVRERFEKMGYKFRIIDESFLETRTSANFKEINSGKEIYIPLSQDFGRKDIIVISEGEMTRVIEYVRRVFNGILY